MADIATLEINTDPLIATLEIQAVLNAGDGGSAWGGITGTLADQTDLAAALNAKAAATHTHSGADITSGTVALARLPASYGGNGVADFGNVATFNAEGGLTAETIHAEAAAGLYVGDANFDASGLTDARAYTLPDADGTLATQEWATSQFTSYQGRRGILAQTTLPPVSVGTNNHSGAGGAYTTFQSNYAMSWSVAAATASTGSCGWGSDSIGSAFGGSGYDISGTAVANFNRKWRLEFIAGICLSAHADSRISLHIQIAGTPTANRPAQEGLSVLWRGGASDGTVEIYSHDGTTGSSSSTAAVSIGDKAVAAWALEWEPGVGARLYRNGTLLCTKATNLPSGNSATSNSQAVWFHGTNTTNGVTHRTSVWVHGVPTLLWIA